MADLKDYLVKNRHLQKRLNLHKVNSQQVIYFIG